MTSELPTDKTTREVFVRLSALVYAGADAASVHQALVDAARRLVDGCDRATLMLKDRDRFVIGAATDDVARRVDEIEIELCEGPCYDAIVDEAYQHQPDLTSGDSPWPEFTERIVAETPVRSAVGFRLMLEGAKAGALNLFADEPGRLTQGSADQAAVVAAFASVSLMAIRAREQAETLRQGLHSNREIGKAIGLLMAAHHMSAERAFELLKTTSHDLNMKLAHVAEQVVRGQDSQFGARPQP